MERDAPYALVGLVAAALFLGLLIFAIWLAQLQLSTQYNLYDVDFKGPVRGLSAGGEVFFNGIKVGEVIKLSLDKRDPNRVVARIRTGSDAPVRVDSYATLEPLGITGVNYIQITAGTTTRPLLKEATPAGQVPVIQTRLGALEGLLAGGGDVLARSVDALDRVNRLLSDRNIANFNAILANVRDVTALAKDQRALFSELNTTVRTVDVAAQRVAGLSADADRLLDGDGRRTIANMNAAVLELKGAAADARSLTATLKGPATTFAATGLPQLTRSIDSLQTAAESLDRLVREVEQNPRQLVAKPPPRALSVPP